MQLISQAKYLLPLQTKFNIYIWFNKCYHLNFISTDYSYVPEISSACQKEVYYF